MFFLFRSLRWELVSGDVIEGHEMREVCGAKGGGELRAENHRRRQLDVKTGKHLTNRVREVALQELVLSVNTKGGNGGLTRTQQTRQCVR